MLKQVFILGLSFLLMACANAQQKDSLVHLDSSLQLHDSIPMDSLPKIDDTVRNSALTPQVIRKKASLHDILQENIFLANRPASVSQLQEKRNYISKDAVFYALAAILLFLGILKVAWPRYFSNLIRVFFNTSLRQGQLTDQLLQARLPSMFFNIFFILIGGWYIYLLLNHFGKTTYDNWQMLLLCIGGLLLIYTAKYSTLKFAGWITGYKSEADTYIFIVFLINKIVSLCLVPIVVILPFSQPGLVEVAVVVSFIIIILMLIMRFFRSYGLLQSKLKVSGFHFFLYIIGIELLPLLLIYKGALVIMSKNQ